MGFHEQMVGKYGGYSGFVYKPKTRPTKGLVCSCGFNDVEFSVQPKIEGKQIVHPIYVLWKNMLARCNDYDLVKYPAYKGVTVSDSWLSLSTFLLWCKDKFSKGLQLDKDLLQANAKLYSADTCCFIPQEINSFTVDFYTNRGNCPLGVDFVQKTNKYRARVSMYNKSKHLGFFSTSSDAHLAWQKAKLEYGKSLNHPSLSRVLNILKKDIDQGLETIQL